MRCLVFIILGCSAGRSPVSNHAVVESPWPRRADELCAAIGADHARGLAALRLDGVVISAEGEGWGSSGGYSGRSWTVTSPSPLRAIGIVGHRERIEIPNGYAAADTAQIAETWLEADVPVEEICTVLGIAVTDRTCTQIRGPLVVSVGIEHSRSRLRCAARAKTSIHV